MTKVKICGITTLDDARFTAQAGADLIGFNFYKKSPRYIDIDLATEICDTLRAELGEKCPQLIGIFVNELVSMISVITNKVGLNGAQLSGDESDKMLQELRGLGYKGVSTIYGPNSRGRTYASVRRVFLRKTVSADDTREPGARAEPPRSRTRGGQCVGTALRSSSRR